MDKFLLEYIAQRMREMGICHYHFEPGRLVPTVSVTRINAYNEFYFITGMPLANAYKIISDTNAFSGNNAGPLGYQFYPVQEFSGLIEIKYSGGIGDFGAPPIEYIHVVPTCYENYCQQKKCCDEQIKK